MNCPKCGRNEAHFVPPSFGEAGFYICEPEHPMTPTHEPMMDQNAYDNLRKENALLRQELAEVTAERDAFIHGGVTEALLRKCAGSIKLAKGCCIVIEKEWDDMLAQLAEAQRIREGKP